MRVLPTNCCSAQRTGKPSSTPTIPNHQEGVGLPKPTQPTHPSQTASSIRRSSRAMVNKPTQDK